jgi:hypothetical protein
MSSIHSLSVQQLRQAADLKEKIEGLEKELSRLLGLTAQPGASSLAETSPRKKGGMSAAGRARLVAAQKARWAKVRAANAAGGIKTGAPRKKFTMSAAAKAKISAAAKARWAKIRAARK